MRRYRLRAKSKSNWLIDILIKCIKTSTTIGDISIVPPMGGIILLAYFITGSVTVYRKLTIGLYGSGLTHEIIALPMIKKE